MACPNCGQENPEGARFCTRCGSEIRRGEGDQSHLEGLTFLLVVGSLYALLSVVFNSLVRRSVFYLPVYSTAGLLGLLSAYLVYREVGERWAKVLVSSVAVVAGFAGTFRLFLVGLMVRLETRGLFGPAWIIFLAIGVKMWLDRRRL